MAVLPIWVYDNGYLWQFCLFGSMTKAIYGSFAYLGL